jgi:Carboxypeptidase regulatory-like domain
MHTRRHLCAHSLSRHRRVLPTKTSLRFAAIFIIVAILSAAIAVLPFAQKPGAVLRSETQTVQPSRVAIPRRSAPARKGSRANQVSASDQEQEQAGRDRQVKGQGSRGDRRPQEGRLRKARPFTGDVRQLPYTQPIKLERPEREAPAPNPSRFVPPGESSASISSESSANAAPQAGLNAPAPPPTANFEGLDFSGFGSGHPPDTNGDVGPNYYIQAINTSIGIFDKSSGTRVAAFSFNSLMSQGQFGNLCDTNNFGDPVVVYDTFEDRWIITDFAFTLNASGAVINPPGAFQCFAVSQSGDPVSGGWNYYSINTAGGLGDYPKFGIWRDGLYMSANMFNYAGTFQNSRVYAFNKAQMYAGAPSAQMVSFDAAPGDFTLLPSNARLQTGTPPAGTPNYYISTWLFTNAVAVYKFRVDWDHLSLSTFTGPAAAVTATSWPNTTVPNAPSLGGNNLDVLQIRAMMQNQYTNIGGAESLWTTHTVRRFDATGFAAPRFYQVPVTGGSVGSATQAATFDPDGANVMYRFMPSLAVDRAGNMALGYSTSSSSTKPAIKYAGRLATDPINTFSQTEQVLIQGAGTQTGSCGGSTCVRWGDYSSMTLDPDGCTFWYTNMYYPVDGLNHHTRIGSFTLPQCTTVGQGTIQGTVTSSSGGGPISGARVTLGSRTATADASGFYSFTGLPAGTYPGMTASFAGYASTSDTNVPVNEGVLTTRNFVLSPGADNACLTDTTQLDFQRGAPTSVDLTTSPGDVMLPNVLAVDQQNTTLGASGFSITPTQWIGQTFMPAVSGNLTKLEVNLFCSGCSGADTPVTVDIRTTSGGLPTATVLASTTIPGFSLANGAYYTATFSSPPALTAGTNYAIMTRVATLRAGSYNATFGNGNPYSRGMLVFGDGSSWGSLSGDDLGFRTYMQSGYPSTGNLVSGLFDANPHSGGVVSWTTLSWNASTPTGTSVKFQVAASNNASGPFTFVGPDGTSGTFYTVNGGSLSRFNGNRYLKYQAFLGTSNNTSTPAVNDVTVCYNNTLPTALTVSSATGIYGGSVNLSATLTDGVSPLSGKTINFALNGNNVGSGLTDGSGVATLLNASLNGIKANAYSGGVSVNFTGDSTFQSNNATNTLTVNKADATIVVTPYNVPFDGNSHTGAGTATGVSGESLSGLDLSGTTHTNASNYSGDHWTFTDVTGNYNNATGTIDDAISRVSSATEVTVGNATYDGNPHGATASVTGTGGLNQSLTVTYSGRNTTVYGPTTTPPANAGDYTAGASYPGDANHNASNDSEDYSIFTASSVTQASVSDATYDGNPHGGAASVTGPGGLSQSVTVSYAGRNSTVYGPSTTPPTNAGDYTATASYAGDANHTASNDAKDYSILRAASVTQTSVSDETYDGNPHGGTASVTGAGGLSQSVTVSYAGRNSTVYGPSTTPPTNAGDYTATASYAGDANHTASDDTKDYSILRAASVTQTSVSDVTYDGNPHGGTASVTGAGGLSQSVTVSYAGRNSTVYGPSTTPPTNAGDYTAGASYTGDANHTGSNDSKDYSILRAASISQTSVSDAIFDGNPHGGSASVTGAGGLNQSLTVTYSGRNTTVYGPSTTAPTNAGDYSASASYAGDANHLNSSDSKGYSIFKAASTTTVICPPTVLSTGSPLTPCTAGATGAGGLSAELTVAYTNNVNPGTATASASYAGDPNHLPSSGVATFVITGSTSAPPFYFVIGDNNAAVGSQVTFWGSRWPKVNSLSGGPAPASFKGFASATSTQPATCGGTWTSDPGNSSGPPATVPEFITVIVSSSISNNGSVISGNNRKLVVVKTNPGYGPDPVQDGTGTVVSIVCP